MASSGEQNNIKEINDFFMAIFLSLVKQSTTINEKKQDGQNFNVYPNDRTDHVADVYHTGTDDHGDNVAQSHCDTNPLSRNTLGDSRRYTCCSNATNVCNAVVEHVNTSVGTLLLVNDKQ